jgi:tRNA(Ile)-lysidine synthase
MRPLAPTPDGLEQRLLARARRESFRGGDSVVVGFSGGRDSLALAAALRRVRAVLGVEPVLVHVDHQLRATSHEEAQRAAELAVDLGLPFRGVSVSSSLRQRAAGVGIEEAARQERYRLLFGEAARMRARAVATAHHQQDQAETVLMHLLRGGGVHGAAGMAERSSSPVPLPPPVTPSDISPESHHGVPWLWRPFLREPRSVIESYVARLGLTPIEDASNEDLGLRRNVVRLDVLPLLEQRFPGAAAALARYAELAAADDALLDRLAADALETIKVNATSLDSRALRRQPNALQRRIVRWWLHSVTGSESFSANRTDAVLDLARGGDGGRAIEMGGGWTARLQQGMLRVEGNTGRENDVGESLGLAGEGL